MQSAHFLLHGNFWASLSGLISFSSFLDLAAISSSGRGGRWISDKKERTIFSKGEGDHWTTVPKKACASESAYRLLRSGILKFSSDRFLEEFKKLI